jgi:hypothetical protein
MSNNGALLPKIRIAAIYVLFKKKIVAKNLYSII